MEVFWVISDASVREEPEHESPLRRKCDDYLDIRCFGQFEISRNGQTLKPDHFKRKSALALVKILLLRSGNPISSDALCDLLWPDAESQSAKNRLHGAVHALRQGIEPHADAQNWLYVCGRGDRYYFNPEAPHRVDFLEFKQLVAQARVIERTGGSPDKALPKLEQADRICRGDLFSDDSDAPWCLAERRWFQECRLEVLCSLARLCNATGEVQRSIEYLRRALCLDPLREDIHRALLEILLKLDRRQDALRQYELCAEALQRELQATPLPATRALYHQIMASLRKGAAD